MLFEKKPVPEQKASWKIWSWQIQGLKRSSIYFLILGNYYCQRQAPVRLTESLAGCKSKPTTYLQRTTPSFSDGWNSGYGNGSPTTASIHWRAWYSMLLSVSDFIFATNVLYFFLYCRLSPRNLHYPLPRPHVQHRTWQQVWQRFLRWVVAQR